MENGEAKAYLLLLAFYFLLLTLLLLKIISLTSLPSPLTSKNHISLPSTLTSKKTTT